MAALECEARVRGDFFKNTGSSVTTLYIGGGTPSVLSMGQMERVVKGVADAFGLSFGESGKGGNHIEEFTVEVNPNDITPEYASFLVSLGVNRVSMGMQSFIDSHLKWMNRRHNAQEGVQAYRILRDAGVKNISLDLIFGYSLLGEQEWKYNIDKMTELAPEHISAYQMSIEPGSVLGAMYRKGCYEPLSDEECLRQYALLQKKLSDAGYVQYEISNFAKRRGSSAGKEEPVKGMLFRSEHNSSYWNGVSYIGLGPAAHSFTGKYAPVGARRLWNTPSVKKYCAHYVDSGQSSGSEFIKDAVESGVIDYEILTEENIFNETVMLGLRRIEGFSLENLNSNLLRLIKPQIESSVKAGLLISEGNNIRIPADKLFISDSIIRELFV